jgi:hypothetical protein
VVTSAVDLDSPCGKKEDKNRTKLRELSGTTFDIRCIFSQGGGSWRPVFSRDPSGSSNLSDRYENTALQLLSATKKNYPFYNQKSVFEQNKNG